MASAGNVSVDVEGRADSLPEVIQAALDSVDTTVEIEADASTAQAEVDSLDGGTIETEVDASVEAAQAEIDSLDGGTTETEVVADTTGAETSISSLSDSVASLGVDVGSLGEVAGDAAGGGGVGGLSAGLGGLARSAGVAGGAVVGIATEIGAAVGEFADAQVVQAESAQLLETTGASAHLTADEMSNLAGEIQSYSGFSDEAVQHGENLLLTFQNVSSETAITSGVFDRATRASADMARLMGGDVPSAALRLGRALDNPARGMTALTRSGVSFTAEQRRAITAMVETGDTLGAQEAILDAVEGQLGGTAAAYGGKFRGQVDIARASVSDLQETIGSQLIPAFEGMLSVTTGAVGGLTSFVSATQGLQDEAGLGGFLGNVVFGSPLSQLASMADDGAGKVQGLAFSFDNASDAAADASREINNFELEMFGLTNANDAFTRAQFAVLDSLSQNGTAITGNTLAAINNRQALQGLVTATSQRVATLRSQDASEGQVAAAQREGISVINRLADRYGWTRQQTERYRQAILNVPGASNTAVNLHGVEQAHSQINGLVSALQALDGIVANASIVVDTIGASLGGHAAGTPSAPPGLAWVGETGPELIDFRGGERVWSAPESARMAASTVTATGGVGDTNVIIVRDVDEAMAWVPPDGQGKFRRAFLAGAL